MKRRIWELDALRGLCILGMVVVHILYDLRVSGLISSNAFVELVQEVGSKFFLLISGICVTLGRRHIRRGILVFLCGMVCTAVTAGMYFLGMAGKGIIIYFGVLHCLGVCMLLWSLFSRLPTWAVGLLSVAMVAVGLLVIPDLRVDFPWLIPLGVKFPGFSSSDYFPLLPNLGFFLIGAVLGRTLYRRKETLFPRMNTRFFLIRFFAFCGRSSLWIYLLHQPVITGVLAVAELFKE